MNPSTEGRELRSSEAADNALPNLQAAFNLSNIVKTSSENALKFGQELEIREFQLGDELLSYKVAASLKDNVQDEHSSEGFYVICQGRVRLLSFDVTQQRQVSTLVLEVGETFGTESLWQTEPVFTRAIAASDVQVAWMSLADIKRWLEQLPQLQDYLYEQARVRECLVFLKTSTQLRLLPSHQLRQLLPYIVETKVAQGESLHAATPASSGHFWLKSGQIQSQGSSEFSAPTVGQSWGYPNLTMADWLAQTDLVVYQLPTEHWEAAQAIAPVLEQRKLSAPSGATSSQRNGHARVNREINNSRAAPKLEISRASEQPKQTNNGAEKSKLIAFPQPPSRRKRREFWRSQPFIGQQSSSDCGAACLSMVGRYWGKQFGINYLRNLAQVGRSGASLKSLAKAAESLGFQARPVRASLSRLVEQTIPWIAHWQGDHYVVVYQVKGDRMLIADPAIGKKTLSRQEFQAGWTGYALLLEPTERLEAAETQKNSLGGFWHVLWPYRSLILQIILISLLIQVFGLLTPLFTQIILDQVVVQKSFITLHVFVIGLVLFGVWRIGLTAARQYMLDYFSNRLDLSLISGFISHTLMLPLKFFASRHVGDIVTRVQENQKLQMFLTRQAVLSCLDALMAVVYIGLMAYYNWRLTLLVLALIPPIVILTLVASPFLRTVSREIFNESAKQNSSLVEMMTGVATVKAAAAERELRWRWEDHLTSTLNARFRGQKLANGLQAAGGLINTLGSTALLWYGATLVIQNQLTIGQFVAFNMLIGNVINPILALVGLWDDLQEVMVSVERLNDVFSAQREEDPQNPMMALPPLRGEVKFENVTFRYDEDEERNTLQNISFTVQPGETIAIVGRSGSGKSTLVSLLQGLYHPTSGRISIDGHDILHVSPQSLRSQLGIVPQECFLFSGTILENITLYRPEFTLEQVVEVAKLAEAHAFIQDLPLGYNTQVGERGTMLSGGQRQRLAIARALLGEPQILVLDEATSSLDTESERRFQQNLSRFTRDRTTFIIAHRLSTVRHADCILVLDRGVLAEQGNHKELMAIQGLYYHLAQQQLDI